MLTYNPLKYTKTTAMENKYKEGDIVTAKENLNKKLIVRRYVDRIYYCKIQGEPNAKELVYFERELVTTPETKTA
jgi:uncharacterized protein YodC (DUF2158 family)